MAISVGSFAVENFRDLELYRVVDKINSWIKECNEAGWVIEVTSVDHKHFPEDADGYPYSAVVTFKRIA